jgi:hypothetical protein
MTPQLHLPGLRPVTSSDLITEELTAYFTVILPEDWQYVEILENGNQNGLPFWERTDRICKTCRARAIPHLVEMCEERRIGLRDIRELGFDHYRHFVFGPTHLTLAEVGELEELDEDELEEVDLAEDEHAEVNPPFGSLLSTTPQSFHSSQQ